MVNDILISVDLSKYSR